MNPTCFTTTDPDYNEIPHTAWFLGVDFKKNGTAQIDLTGDINKFVEIGKFLSRIIT